jgi:hypothetical protein
VFVAFQGETNMTFTNFLRKSLPVCALLAQAAGAATIIQSNGNSGGSVPLGYYAPYAPNNTPIVYAVEWTQTAAFTNIDVTANLFTPGSPGTVNYALVTALGAGTTFAADGIIRGSATTPANPANVDLFHLASLGPGTYFLVLDSPVANTSWQYNFPITGNYTMANGVAFDGDQMSSASSINASYTPGSSFFGVGLPVEFAVTGTATPEPATFGLLAMALAGVWIGQRLYGRLEKVS